jgi:hypothetical protein
MYVGIAQAYLMLNVCTHAVIIIAKLHLYTRPTKTWRFVCHKVRVHVQYDYYSAI